MTYFNLPGQCFTVYMVIANIQKHWLQIFLLKPSLGTHTLRGLSFCLRTPLILSNIKMERFGKIVTGFYSFNLPGVYLFTQFVEFSLPHCIISFCSYLPPAEAYAWKEVLFKVPLRIRYWIYSEYSSKLKINSLNVLKY